MLRLGKGRHFGDHQTLQRIMRVSDPRRHKQYERQVRNCEITLWERERENTVLVDSCTNLAQIPVIRLHLLHTGGRLQKLAITTSYGV